MSEHLGALLLLLPTVLCALLVHPGTSLGTFVAIAGLGGATSRPQ